MVLNYSICCSLLCIILMHVLNYTCMYVKIRNKQLVPKKCTLSNKCAPLNYQKKISAPGTKLNHYHNGAITVISYR